MNLSNTEEFIAIQHKRRASLSEQRIQPWHYNTDIVLEEVSEVVVIARAQPCRLKTADRDIAYCEW
jgi:hypothetical protein